MSFVVWLLTLALDRSRRKTSVVSLSSDWLVRFEASDANAIFVPSPEIEGLKLSSAPCVVLWSLSDTFSVTPAVRSRQKTSVLPLVSLATRFVASEENATFVPLLSTLGSSLASSPGPALPVATLTSVVDGLDPSVRTKTSVWPLPSPATRLVADEVKATTTVAALSLIDGDRLSPLAWVPSPPTLTRVTVLSERS